MWKSKSTLTNEEVYIDVEVHDGTIRLKSSHTFLRRESSGRVFWHISKRGHGVPDRHCAAERFVSPPSFRLLSAIVPPYSTVQKPPSLCGPQMRSRKVQCSSSVAKGLRGT
jgi:hypothetical protein